MKMSAAELMKAELIGLEVEVLSAPFSGISGRVVDETKNTFTIESAGTERMVPKSGNEFRFTYRGTQIEIEGNKILHRPEDRMKKVR